ncbi:MAG: hypothetical protein HZB10_00405 [Candidatus Yonathbacteria bacterium]|nr:hypothetical protein [Candidatus Yonathbacteria bacterium]
MTNEEIKSKWLGHIEGAEKAIHENVRHIQSRADLIRVTSGRTLRLDLERSVDPALRKLNNLRKVQIYTENMLQKYDELDNVTTPVFKFLHEMGAKISKYADEAFEAFVSKGKETKSFS